MGHGKSHGTPLLVSSFDGLVDDLALFAAKLRVHYTVQQQARARRVSVVGTLNTVNRARGGGGGSKPSSHPPFT